MSHTVRVNTDNVRAVLAHITAAEYESNAVATKVIREPA